MRARYEHVLHKVFFFGTVRRNALTAAVLGAVFGGGQSLDIAVVRHRDHHVFFFDQVADVDLVVVDAKLGAAGGIVFFLYLVELVFHDLFHAVGIGDNVFKIGNGFFERGQLGAQVLHFQAREPLQAHFQDSVGYPKG